MKKLIIISALLLLSLGAYAQNTVLVGSVPTLADKGKISVFVEGDDYVYITLPKGGFTLSLSQTAEVGNTIGEFSGFENKAREAKIRYVHSLPHGYLSVSAPLAGKIVLVASTDNDGVCGLGIRLIDANPVSSFGQYTTYWLDSTNAKEFGNIMYNAIGANDTLKSKYQSMRSVSVLFY